MKTCWVEIQNNRPVRIFKSRTAAVRSNSPLIEMEKAVAVKSIRWYVYHRAGGQCEVCGKLLTWDQMHLDEKQSRGRGGEVSVANGQCLCADCHILRPDSKHGDRRWHSVKVRTD